MVLVDGTRNSRNAGEARPTVDLWSSNEAGTDKLHLVVGALAATCGLSAPVSAKREEISEAWRKLGVIPGFRIDGRDNAADVAYSKFDERGLSNVSAEGRDGLVINLVFGKGTNFTLSEARESARSAVSRAGERGSCPAVALLLQPHQPPGQSIGCALEVEEAICCLRGKGPPDLEKLCLALASEMILLGFADGSPDAARERARAALADGSALAMFRAMVVARGGDARVVDDPSRLPQSSHSESVNYIGTETGWVGGVDSRLVGEAARLLGSGHRRQEDSVDPTTGLSELIKVGARISVGTPLARLHYNDDGYCPLAHDLLRRAVRVSPQPPESLPLIVERIGYALKGS